MGINRRPPRIADDHRPDGSTQRWTEHCRVCQKPTRERKLYCSEHVLTTGYAQKVAAVEERARSEVAAVIANGPSAVNIEGLIVDEILAGIAEAGHVTYRRLIKNSVIYLARHDSSVADLFLERLVQEELVTVGQTKRGSIIATLTAKGWNTRHYG